MSDKILIMPPGILSNSKRSELKKNGYIVVETDSLDAVKIITPTPAEFETNDVLDAAIYAISQDRDICKTFMQTWYAKIKQRKTPQNIS